MGLPAGILVTRWSAKMVHGAPDQREGAGKGRGREVSRKSPQRGLSAEEKLAQAASLLKLEKERLEAAKNRLETNKQDALKQGEILKAVSATVELQKQELKFKQEFLATSDLARQELQDQLRYAKVPRYGCCRLRG
mgnify:CR=1 FL=1